MATTNHPEAAHMGNLVDTPHTSPERSACPCLSAKAMHIGSCTFAGAMAGAVLAGIWGGVVGGAFGLFVGFAAAYSKNA